MNSVQGKVALVTGGASGIGLGLGKELARQGAKVVLADINGDALKAVASGFSDGVETVVLDVRDRDQWSRAREMVEAKLGPVSILANNAGIMNEGGGTVDDRGLIDQPAESFDRIIAINLTGVFNGIQAFAPGMCERGEGHIVNTSSTQGVITCRGVGAYCASKFGVVALSESLRGELEPYGVGVSVLCPGVIQTGLPANSNRLVGLSGTEMPPGFGMDPAIVAGMVIAGIEGNKPYIFTHGEYADPVARRHERIQQALSETPVSPFFREGDPLPGTHEYAAARIAKTRTSATVT